MCKIKISNAVSRISSDLILSCSVRNVFQRRRSKFRASAFKIKLIFKAKISPVRSKSTRQRFLPSGERRRTPSKANRAEKLKMSTRAKSFSSSLKRLDSSSIRRGSRPSGRRNRVRAMFLESPLTSSSVALTPGAISRGEGRRRRSEDREDGSKGIALARKAISARFRGG